MPQVRLKEFIVQCLIICCVCRSVCSENDSEMHFLSDVLQLRESRPYEIFIKHDFSELNVTSEFSNLLKASQNLGFELANNWVDIERSLQPKAVAATCVRQIGALVAGLAAGQLTSFKYFDSWGKIPAGILKGHIQEFGNFDQCVDLRKMLENDAQITGKYCLAKLPLGALVMPDAIGGTEFDMLYKLLLRKLLGLKLSANTTIVSEESCSLRKKPPLQAWDWVTIAVLIILTLAMLFSTLYEYFTKLAGKKPNPILSSFGVLTNMKQLLLVQPIVKSANVIPCLNGIRCISLIWIFLGHVFGLFLNLPHINSIDLLSWGKTVFAQLIQRAPYAVDTFFFLSGFLVTFIVLKAMDRNNGKLNIGMMYLHRIIRLLPMVGLAILVYATLYAHMGNGPVWAQASKWNDFCRNTWWSTLLFVQNYVHPNKLCIGHSWYLAVDMQLYVFAPFAVLILWKWQRKGFAAIALVGVLFVVCLFTTIMVNDYSYHTKGFLIAKNGTFRKTYFATHARTSPWIVGILFGYYMHTTKGSRVQLSKLFVLFGWLTCVAIFGAILFGLYPNAVNRTDTTTLEEAFYWSLGRVAWPLALAWIVFACVNEYAGPINAFLSCPLWQPFARLSYSIYIWHILLVEYNTGSVKINTYFSTYDLTLAFWAVFGWSLLLSTYMHLAFEAPLLNLEKVLLPKPNKAQSPKITISKENLIPTKLIGNADDENTNEHLSISKDELNVIKASTSAS